MNILLVNYIQGSREGAKTIGGVEYHRMLKPNLVLKSIYPEYDHIMVDGIGDELEEDGILSQTDLVIFCRQIPDGVAEYLNNKGIPFGLDIDDYWHLPEHHILYQDYIDNKKDEMVERSIREAHFVTCTTSILAEKILPFNPNVHVIPNGIDASDPVWQPNKTESKRLRFGFTGGNTHLYDVNRIAQSVRKAYTDVKFYKNAQIVLTGYRHSEGKDIQPERIYENMLTDNRNILKYYPQYNFELGLGGEGSEKDAPYRRILNKRVDEFGLVYNDIDVCVAPLEANEFNSCKSELKMLEAGVMDCAVMCHHIAPYNLLATDKNSFDLCKKTFYEWSRILLKNPNLVADTKAQLKQDIKRYDLKFTAEHRHLIYQKYGKKEKTTKEG